MWLILYNPAWQHYGQLNWKFSISEMHIFWICIWIYETLKWVWIFCICFLIWCPCILFKSWSIYVKIYIIQILFIFPSEWSYYSDMSTEQKQKHVQNMDQEQTLYQILTNILSLQLFLFCWQIYAQLLNLSGRWKAHRFQEHIYCLCLTKILNMWKASDCSTFLLSDPKFGSHSVMVKNSLSDLKFYIHFGQPLIKKQ